MKEVSTVVVSSHHALPFAALKGGFRANDTDWDAVFQVIIDEIADKLMKYMLKEHPKLVCYFVFFFFLCVIISILKTCLSHGGEAGRQHLVLVVEASMQAVLEHNQQEMERNHGVFGLRNRYTRYSERNDRLRQIEHNNDDAHRLQ